jgi:hypothetical protein
LEDNEERKRRKEQSCVTSKREEEERTKFCELNYEKEDSKDTPCSTSS